MTDESLTILFDRIIEHFADRVADRLARRLRDVEPNMVSQEASPLGRRRHCAVVKRRVAAGLPGGSIVGRKHLLTHEALAEEMAKLSTRVKHPGRSNAANLSIKEELAQAIAETSKRRA